MNANERLNRILEHTGCTYNSLARKIGLKRSQNLYDIRNGKIKTISLQLATAIVETYPEFSSDWLLTGDGPMLISITATNNEEEDTSTDTKQINHNNVIPIYEIEIDAGNVSRLIDDNKNVPIAGHFYLKDSENASGLIGVRAKGDSMATFINGGDIMLIRRLESRSFIPPGNAYVIIGKELSVVKYIRNSSDKTKWLLRSHNEFYQDFEVNKADVVHLFIVVKVLKELTY